MDENNIEVAQFYKELAYRALTEEPSSLSMEFKETAKAIRRPFTLIAHAFSGAKQQHAYGQQFRTTRTGS